MFELRDDRRSTRMMGFMLGMALAGSALSGAQGVAATPARAVTQAETDD